MYSSRSVCCAQQRLRNEQHAATHVEEVAELIVLGGDEADPARGVLMLSAVLHVHLEEGRESLEEVSEARFIRERRHSPLRTGERKHDATTREVLHM